MQCSCQNRWSYRLLLFSLGYVELPRDDNTSVLKLISLLPPLSPSFPASLTPTAFSSSPPLFLTSSSLHQKSTSSASSEASETCQSVSECNSPTAVSTACVSSLYWTHSQTCTHRHTGCCTIHLLYSVVESGPWVVLDSRTAGWCGLVMDVKHSDSLVCPFRSLAHAHPSVPFALLSLTLAPSSGLSLSYFLRPPHLTTPLDPTPPHPHQRFLAGRFVFICNFAFGFFSF